MVKNPEDTKPYFFSNRRTSVLKTELQSRPYTTKEIQDWFVAKFSEVLDVEADRINVEESVTSYALGSIQLVSLVGELEDWLGRQLPPTVLSDYPTLRELARYLAEESDYERS